MDKEVIERALKAGMSANEWKILAALSLGHLEIYDIQRVTGIKRHRVEEILSAQIVHTVLHTGDIYITSLPLGNTAQNVQQGRTPPEAILTYLYKQLGMNLPARWTSQLSIVKDLYILAYESLGRDQRAALLALKDCIDIYRPELLAAGVPVKYLVPVFRGYLRGMPAKTKDRREYEAFSGKTSRWNAKTKMWENR